MRFRNSKIRCTFKSELLIDGHDLIAESDLHKEGRILVCIDSSYILIKINEILILRKQLITEFACSGCKVDDNIVGSGIFHDELFEVSFIEIDDAIARLHGSLF